MSFYFLNSEYANNSDDAKSIYDFTIEINNNHDRISLYQCEIPKSMYNIPSGSNTFYLDATLHTIPPGNYTLRSLQTVLNAIAGLTVTFSSTTGKFTFAGAFNTISFPSTSMLYLCFGFTYASTNNFAAGTITSTNVINLQTNTTVNIHCGLCRNETNGASNDVLHKLEIASTSDYSVHQWQNEQLRHTSKILVPNRTVRIHLTNEYDENINLNGLSFNLVLYTYSSAENKDTYTEKIFTLLYNTIDKIVLQK